MAHASERFTTPGRILVFVSTLAGGGAIALFAFDVVMFWILEVSDVVPKVLFVLPGLAVFGIVFGIGAILFRVLGWRILRREETSGP